VTIQEFADRLGCSREAAEGLVRFLRERDLVRFRGERPAPGRRGKGAYVYDVAPGIEAALAQVGVQLGERP